MADTTQTQSPAPDAGSVTITLSTPIARKGGDIAEITLRKPKGGDLRGLKVEDLFATDVNTLIQLLPRIVTPMITAHDVEQLEADDLLEVAGTVKGFFFSPALKEAMTRALGG